MATIEEMLGVLQSETAYMVYIDYDDSAYLMLDEMGGNGMWAI